MSFSSAFHEENFKFYKMEIEANGSSEKNQVLQKRLFTPFLLKAVPPIPTDDERRTYPTYTNPILWFLFTWLIPVMETGYKRTLVPNDMYKLNENIKAEHMADRFMEVFQRRFLEDKEKHRAAKAKAREAQTPGYTEDPENDMDDYVPAGSLAFYSMLETFKYPYLLAVVFCALSQAGQTCNPLLTKKLISFVEARTFGLESSVGKGVGYAIGVSFVVLVSDLLNNQMFYISTIIGGQLKALFTKLMLDKSFKLNSRSRKLYPPSKITSIMSTDLNRVDKGFGYSPLIITAPVPIAISIGILIHNLKASALLGIGIMILDLFASAGLGALLFIYRNRATKDTDKRVGLMKEVLNNLKMIKFYSWETAYLAMIKTVRKGEMRNILKMQVTRSTIISMAVSLSSVASFASFMLLYGIASPSLRNPASIFSSVALFSTLSLVFIQLPLAIAGATDAMIGLKRASDFLTADEEAEDEARTTTASERLLLQEKKLALSVTDGDFEWEIFDIPDADEEKKKKKEKKAGKKSKKAVDKESSDLEEEKSKPQKPTFRLHDINLDVHVGEFVVVTGLIGSGKSSLLCALEGAMKRNSGQVKTNGSMVLCGVPWIQNSTIQENIIFNSPLDKAWYDQVIVHCCLESDLDIFPAGDQTEIGERGITLSGGQKARVALARAVYARSDIILLDDVLSAVDAKVGKRIVDECILGLLKDKTVVLATHQLSLIGSADKVVFLNGDGTIDVGTLQQLRASNTTFLSLVMSTQKHPSTTENTTYKSDMYEKQSFSEIEQDGISDSSESKEEMKKNDGKLVVDETSTINALGFNVYRRYIGAGLAGFKGGWILPVVVGFTILAVFFSIFTNTWLSFWVSYKWKDRSDGFYIGLYAAFTFLGLVTLGLGFLGVIFVLNNASRWLNIRAAERILFVPMYYMDVTPMGRIINRFTKDTDVLDNEMGERVTLILYFAAYLVGVIVLCIIYLPWFAIAVPFLVFVFVGFANFYSASGREIKRVESIQRSHVYNNFNETLTGMDTIKSYQRSEIFLENNVTKIDRMNEAYYLTLANMRWLDVSVSILSTAFALLISFLCIFRVFNISASSVGLVLNYVLLLSGMCSLLVVVATQTEQDMNSADRIIEYVYDLPQEAAYVVSETTPRPSWPEKGEIKFDKVNLAYRPGLPLVLKDFTASLRPTEKIGICGRTGAGKSSIMVALYRLVELQSGSISIDGIDIKSLGLNNLRSKLSIIPQDPVLFKGSIRKNLDPLGLESDEVLWETLRRGHIIKSEELENVKKQTDPNKMHKFHLDREVELDGENFSLGEKQLIAFARALVRGSKVLILDEATSSVDYATDAILQEAIIKEFSDCTILCIAHRLKTILHYDRVIVMDQGEVAEFDTPWNLYNKDGLFRQMCEKADIHESDFVST